VEEERGDEHAEDDHGRGEEVGKEEGVGNEDWPAFCGKETR